MTTATKPRPTAPPSTLPAIGETVFVLFDNREIEGRVSEFKSRTLFLVQTDFLPFVCSVKDVRREA